MKVFDFQTQIHPRQHLKYLPTFQILNLKSVQIHLLKYFTRLLVYYIVGNIIHIVLLYYFSHTVSNARDTSIL